MRLKSTLLLREINLELKMETGRALSRKTFISPSFSVTEKTLQTEILNLG